jgi:hypothetical protein
MGSEATNRPLTFERTQILVKRRAQQTGARRDSNAVHHNQMGQRMTHSILTTTGGELGLRAVRHPIRVALIPAKEDTVKIKI